MIHLAKAATLATTKSHESGDHFQELTRSPQDALIICEKNGKISSANKNANKLFGYSENEISGKNLDLILPKEYWRPYLDKIFNGGVSDGESFHPETIEALTY